MLFVAAAYVQVQTFGMNIKGSEIRSSEVALGAIETLQENGAVEADLDPDKVWELSRTIKQPIEDQIFITQRRFLWTSAYMAIVGVAVLLVAWFPVRKPKEVE
ncbi:MAG: hypothetical protein CMJ35_09275 [Phycisphaerae bacterium]|nr:hypothetical protein [Phycisphaerae bacterium]